MGNTRTMFAMGRNIQPSKETVKKPRMQKCLPESNCDKAPIHRSRVVQDATLKGTETNARNLLRTTTAVFVKSNRLKENKRPTDWGTIKGENQKGKSRLWVAERHRQDSWSKRFRHIPLTSENGTFFVLTADDETGQSGPMCHKSIEKSTVRSKQ